MSTSSHGIAVDVTPLQQVLEQHPGIHRAMICASDAPGAPPLTAYLVPNPDRAAAVYRLLQLEADGALDRQTVHELPNGVAIVQQNPTETDACYQEIFAHGIYLSHGVQIRPGDCVFDAGANIGVFSLLLALRCQPLTIYAFEPIPQLFQKLSLNLTIHGIDAQLVQAGLADTPGSAVFTFYPSASVLSGRFPPGAASDERLREVRALVGSYMREQHAERIAQLGSKADRYLDLLLADRVRGEQIECRLTTISEMIAQHGIERIDLLKIDVEKSELRVLQGIQPHDWPKIRQVVVEVHEDDDEVDQIVDLLRRHGFTPTVEPDPIHHAPGLYLVFATRPEQRSAATAPASQPAHEYRSPRALLDDVQAFAAQHMPDYAASLRYELCLTPPV